VENDNAFESIARGLAHRDLEFIRRLLKRPRKWDSPLCGWVTCMLFDASPIGLSQPQHHDTEVPVPDPRSPL